MVRFAGLLPVSEAVASDAAHAPHQAQADEGEGLLRPHPLIQRPGDPFGHGVLVQGGSQRMGLPRHPGGRGFVAGRRCGSAAPGGHGCACEGCPGRYRLASVPQGSLGPEAPLQHNEFRSDRPTDRVHCRGPPLSASPVHIMDRSLHRPCEHSASQGRYDATSTQEKPIEITPGVWWVGVRLDKDHVQCPT